MHPNPAFRGTKRDINVAFARSRGFGTLALSTDAAPLLSHVPFLLSEDGNLAELHLVRSNPIARVLGDGPRTATLAVTGPEGYISPDWYEVDDQVPTWNYVAVHIRGRLEMRPADTLGDVLDRQSAHFEDQLAPKPPWTRAKMTEEVMVRMLRMIVPVRLHIDGVDGTWKLNQNKDDAVRLRAADAVARVGIGAELNTLAALMRDA